MTTLLDTAPPTCGPGPDQDRDTAELVGRGPALTEVLALLAGEGPGLLLYGPPGVGKSRLARAAAELARASGRLLLLDDVDRMDPFEARTLLAGARTNGAKVLATARHREPVGGLSPYPVRPLGLPFDCSEADLAGFAGVPSVRLFAACATELNPDFRIHRGNQHAIARICVDLCGLPAALVLAARIAVLEGTEVLTAALDGRPGPHGAGLAPLARGYRTATGPQPPGPGTVQRRLLEHAALFTGGFGPEALRQVSGVPVEEFPAALEALIGRHWLTVSTSPSGCLGGLTRVRLHLPLPVLAELPAADPAPRRARLAHARYYARLVAATVRRLDENTQPAGTAALHSEERNIRAALDTLLAEELADEALRLIDDLRGSGHTAGRLFVGAEHLPALARSRTLRDQRRLTLLLAESFLYAGESEAARTLLSPDQDPRPGPQGPAGDPHAARRLRLGGLAEYPRDPDAGTALLRAAAERYRAQDDQRAATEVWLEAALAEFLCGHAARAAQLVRQELPAVLRRQDPSGFGSAMLHLAVFARATGEAAAAREYTERALAGLRTVGPAAVLGAFTAIAGSPLHPGRGARTAASVRVLGSFHASRGACVGIPTEPDLLVSRIEERLRTQMSEQEFLAALGEGVATPLQCLVELLAAAGGPAPPPAPAEQPEPVGEPVLTRRQLEVSLLVSDGLSNRQIARRLEISEWTVVNHMRQIMKRLGCSSRVQVSRWVLSTRPAPSPD